ncbi:DUF5677 domain-containing protein [Dactylosporangium sp. NBC_01737]|uniref:DUF5677 domain-containing protein n=1 Tax=Dactylosporangium sp. NBC_01737 TaxID=2975959 RepID=UPI002E14FD7C|nr:DUF5677 domain-containing protein [Dactylosporangium sp. NBC_01737]
MNWTSRHVAVDDVQVFEPDWRALRDAGDENPFMHAAVELLKSSLGLASALAGIVPGQPLGLHAAIRCGLLVRACKLCTDLLADVCVLKGRQQLALIRELIETLANLSYLCGDDEHGSRHVAFLQDSLIAEREFLKAVERQQALNGGAELPIEARIRASIIETALAAGIDLEQLPGRRQINWPTALDRIEMAFGATAYPAFRTGSGAVHGTWHDVLRNHLVQVDGGFEPNFQAVPPRPQPLLSAAIQLTTTAITYLRRQPDVHQRMFNEPLAAALGFAFRADETHERWLTTGGVQRRGALSVAG